ncbi:hypothetical protein AUEXF2481DRAFT_606265 [Aureobasidium subglaciale EXF-2481]|uniref:C2H2-type domain-containing protein n=1 Tax=Aureobasidium subglaciale (strain EXF-2481) TaxID=1043005 RepID=A0A074Y2Q6_AURSE|nr:uncharacterized protein AUEXF2481DRAFT_606265 [Aureobasidium subglaciale EXF-2481]KEQ90194.1 hypothetical protein AUEXF2481DRAFT_606265 [Aureobasidium subglaciale EXF-2481]
MVHFLCTRCTYSSAVKGLIKTHLGGHHGFGPFECTACRHCAERREKVELHIRGSNHPAAGWANNSQLNTVLDQEVALCTRPGPLPATQGVAAPTGGQLGGGANPAPMPAPIVAAPAPLPALAQVNPPALGQGVAGPLAPGQGQVGPAADDHEDEEDAEEEDTVLDFGEDDDLYGLSSDEADAITQDEDGDDDAEAGEEEEDNEIIGPSTPPGQHGNNNNNNNNNNDDAGGSPGLRLMILKMRMELGLY